MLLLPFLDLASSFLHSVFLSLTLKHISHLFHSLVFPNKDIYGGAEDVVGNYKRAYGSKDDQGLFYTK